MEEKVKQYLIQASQSLNGAIANLEDYKDSERAFAGIHAVQARLVQVLRSHSYKDGGQLQELEAESLGLKWCKECREWVGPYHDDPFNNAPECTDCGCILE